MNNIFLEDLILDKDEHIKYNVFKKIEKYRFKEISTGYLATYLNLSVRTMYNVVENINNDFIALKSNPLFSIEKGKKLQINPTSVSLNEYKIFLFKNSLTFKFFFALSFRTNCDIHKFCKTHFITKTSLSRKLKRFDPITERFNIRISIGKFEFIGREENIRAFIYNLFWIGTDGFFWPFDISEKEYLNSYISKNPALQQFLLNEIIVNQISWRIIISIKRSMKGNRLAKNNTIHSVLKSNRYFQSIKYLFDSEPLKNFSEADLEYLYIVITSKPILSRDSPFSSYSLEFYKENIRDIYQLCVSFREHMIRNSNISYEGFPNCEFVNFMAIAFGLYILDIPFISLKYTQNSAYEKVFSITKSFLLHYNNLSENIWFSDKIDLLANMFSQLLIITFGPEIFTPTFKIGIIWEIERAQLDRIIHFLSLPPGVSLNEINIHTTKEEFDLIISTSMIEIPDTTLLYIWQKESLAHNIINLLTIINTSTFERQAPYI